VNSDISIELRDVCVAFKTRKSFFRHSEKHALRNISFNVYRGETLGVVGRNGCGKSTLLKVLSGVFSPDSGTIKHHDKQITLQTLSAGFDNELSGRDNALISSMLLGKTKKEATLHLEQVLDFSELGTAFDMPVKTYSAGMKARLGFSVALAIDAQVLLIDEVLGVGDKAFQKKAKRAMVNKINSNMTVVFVSHVPKQIESLCTRVVWLEDGFVKDVGETSVVMPKYYASL
tara:strand:- start:1496 stop:2188 length:693 start_codon:yes stop_codon:yes gene_type:complete